MNFGPPIASRAWVALAHALYVAAIIAGFAWAGALTAPEPSFSPATFGEPVVVGAP